MCDLKLVGCLSLTSLKYLYNRISSVHAQTALELSAHALCGADHSSVLI